MGSWNGTCGVTQLPILSGERVRLCLIALTGEVSTDGYCYPTGINFPITTAMPGEYDDYGGVILDDATTIDLLSFKNSGIKIPDEDAGLVRMLRDQKPVFSCSMGKFPIGLWMVRENIYQTMLHKILSEDNFFHSSESYDQMRTQADEAVLELLALHAEYGDDIIPSHIFRTFNYWDRYQSNKHFTRHWVSQDIRFRIGMRFLTDTVQELLLEKKANKENLTELLYAMVDVIRMNYAMDILRKGYTVQSGAGSQAAELNAAKVLAGTIMIEVKSLKNYYEE